MANHFILREKNPYKVVTDFYHLVSIYLYIIFLHLSKMDISEVCLVVFNATFNTISVISWRSVLLVEETGGPGENHRLVASH